ncbi:MAG TPA: HAD family hydrolase [Acidobacteriaceae bacterium]|jgi:D-glycero-D-manno-heptose 1,7-bisphosphate phosphatase
MTNLRPALFLDRDGVVNREIGYLYLPDQVEFTPGIFDLCRHAQALGYALIIITNQSGIARQLYSETDFRSFMEWMMKEFLSQNIRVDGYYFCPHHPEYGVGPYRKECEDRKPQPGMILKASTDHKINLQRSILIGDRCSDIQAGAAAGIPNLVLVRGTEVNGCGDSPAHSVVSGLDEIIQLLISPNTPACNEPTDFGP